MFGVEIVVSIWYTILVAGTLVVLVLTAAGRKFACMFFTRTDYLIGLTIAAAVLLGIYFVTAHFVALYIGTFLLITLLVSFLLQRAGMCPV